MARRPAFISDIKKLFALSGNSCAFALQGKKCNERLVTEKGFLIGEICHIEACNPEGPRYNHKSDDEYRRSFSNLLLLCPNHHCLIDADESISVTNLLEMKRNHEMRFLNNPYQEPPTIADMLEHKIVALRSAVKLRKNAIGDSKLNLLIDEGKWDEVVETIKKEFQENENDLRLGKKNLSIYSFTLAILYTLLLNYLEAENYYQKAIDLQPTEILYIRGFADFYLLIAEWSKSRLLVEKSMKLNIDELGIDHQEVADDLASLGNIESHQKNYIAAIDYYNQAAHIYNKWKDYEKVVDLTNKIGMLFMALFEYPNATHSFLYAWDIIEKNCGSEHSQKTLILNNIAYSYNLRNEFRHALPFLELACKSITEERDAELISAIYSNLGKANIGIKNFEKAIEYETKAFTIDKEAFGIGHIRMAKRYNNLAYALKYAGNYKEAIANYYEAIKIDKEIYGEEHPETATGYNNLSIAYGELGEHSKALNYARKAVKIDEAALPKNHPDLGRDYNALALGFQFSNDPKNAIKYFKRSFDIFKTTLGILHPSTKTVQENLSAIVKKSR